MDPRHALKLGRIAGIEVGVHYTWLVIGVLVAWSLAQGALPASYPGWGAAVYWTAGILAALALFASVLIHELAHSLVAGRLGVRVESITLFVFGGVSTIRDEPRRPRDEFLIAVVGPLASLTLAALLWVLRGAVPLPAPGSVQADLLIPRAVLDYLVTLNAVVGVFNLLPGFPLDGGRVLRSILWGSTHSLRRATDIASYVGQAVGFGLVFAGLGLLLSGDVLDGLWTAFIGWFLNGAAEATRRDQALEQDLSGIPVARLMDIAPPTAPPSMSVRDFVLSHALWHGRRSLLVVADGRLLVVADGRLLGIVTLADAKHVPQSQWATTPLAQIMTPTPLRTAAPDSPLNVALQTMVREALNQLPVVDGDR
ncbi:MAG TPA: site-2 protease family protein, partial [Chloroflexota bacterium]|nr:site-2 protease family protein [Chloroflexota bacterium]